MIFEEKNSFLRYNFWKNCLKQKSTFLKPQDSVKRPSMSMVFIGFQRVSTLCQWVSRRCHWTVDFAKSVFLDFPLARVNLKLFVFSSCFRDHLGPKTIGFSCFVLSYVIPDHLSEHDEVAYIFINLEKVCLKQLLLGSRFSFPCGAQLRLCKAMTEEVRGVMEGEPCQRLFRPFCTLLSFSNALCADIN